MSKSNLTFQGIMNSVISSKFDYKAIKTIFSERKCLDINLRNRGLSRIHGMPKAILGNFMVSNNRLSNLAGSPEKVEGCFYCNDNYLTSLLGIPKYIGGLFICKYLNGELNDVSDIWDSEINIMVDIDVNFRTASLPLVKFNAFFNFDNRNILVEEFNCWRFFDIHKRNKGSSKQNVLNFQYDLIEHGFSENARWKP